MRCKLDARRIYGNGCLLYLAVNIKCVYREFLTTFAKTERLFFVANSNTATTVTKFPLHITWK